MLHRPNEASQSHKEEKDTHTNDASHHLETGDQTKPLSPCCDANHQETDHLQDRHTGWVWKWHFVQKVKHHFLFYQLARAVL